jgi:hypothetical protein
MPVRAGSWHHRRQLVRINSAGASLVVEGMKEARREFVPAEGSHEFWIDLRVAFEPGSDVNPCGILDFADKMPERRRAEAVQMLDKQLAPESRLRLRVMGGEFKTGEFRS